MRRPNHVPKWGTQIVFCKPFKKTKENDQGEEHDETFWVMRTYTVFNVDQVEGMKVDRFRVGQEPMTSSEIEERFEQADQLIDATGADIRYGGDRAFYRADGDYIQMPHRHQFAFGEFFETMWHELTHWTDHPSRLNWDRTKPENSYALGELIAELSSCYVSGELGLPVERSLRNHASYLQSWLQALKGDSKFIFKAASQATKAADFLLAFAQATETEPEEVLTV